MKVKQALAAYISKKTAANEVIHLTKTKQQLGKVEMTIGAFNGDQTQYSIYSYSKACRCGELSFSSSDPCRVADYLIDFCSRDFLKKNLPLWRYENVTLYIRNDNTTNHSKKN